MARIAKSGLVVVLVALLVGLTLWPARASHPMLRFQETEPALVEVASGPLREPTLALNGRGDFAPESVVLFGFVSAIGGLGASDLFTDETQSEQTARFTFVADLEVDSVTNQADVTITAASGSMRVYLSEAAGATWDNRDSFAAGQKVAEYSLDLRETLHRQAPGIGLAVGSGRLIQTAGEEFALGEERFRFGFADMEQRLRYLGAIIPGSQSGQTYAVGLTGQMEVSGREAIIARVGGPESLSEAATPASEVDACAQLEPWLSGTVERLTQVGAVTPDIAGDGTVESLDAAALQQAAADVASVVTEQREAIAPVEASAAHRLSVTALSTYARGLQLLADAANAQDADLLAQGQAALNDGSSLLARAVAEVNTIAPACVAGVS